MESPAEGYLPRNIYHVPLYLDTLGSAEGEIALPLTSARNSRNVSVNVSASLRQKIVRPKFCGYTTFDAQPLNSRRKDGKFIRILLFLQPKICLLIYLLSSKLKARVLKIQNIILKNYSYNIIFKNIINKSYIIYNIADVYII